MPQLLAHLFGDYLLQSDWMAQNKTKAHWPAFVHALLYTLCFVPIFLARHSSDACILTILGTHFLIDRYRLARYVVWAKNEIAPKRERFPRLRDSWDYCKETGMLPSTPEYMAKWLLIIADNTLHLAINYAALRWL